MGVRFHHLNIHVTDLIDGDRVQIQQVVLNLLLNAADAMNSVEGRTKQLTIITKAEDDDRVRLSVRDVGIGISSSEAEKLFNAFYTTKKNGMGIGLSVSRSIIESHKGRLWAAPNEGHGAVFSFSIPVQVDSGAALTGARAATDNKKRKRGLYEYESPLISVVDDDESIRESLPDLIREFGFSVNAFSSAEEFLKSDCLNRTRCLILDIAMPGMSGPDLQEELKRRRQEIPIVFITAHVDETDRPRLNGNGAIDCLYKPFSDADLLRAVNNALEIG